MKKVKIYRSKILDACRAYTMEHGQINWDDFGLQWLNPPSHIENYIYFEVLDKDKLLWAMFKYNFNVYDVDCCE